MRRGVVREQLGGVGREHEPSLEAGQHVQQPAEVGLGVAAVVPHVGVVVRRIDVEEGVLAVGAADDGQGIAAEDGGVFQAAGVGLSEGFLAALQLPSHVARHAAFPCATEDGVKRLMREHPHGPCAAYGGVPLGGVVDGAGLAVRVLAVERLVDLRFEGRVVRLQDAVEVGNLAVDVVHELHLRRLLAPKDCPAAKERLYINAVLGNHREDDAQHLLFAAVVRDRRLHFWFVVCHLFTV